MLQQVVKALLLTLELDNLHELSLSRRVDSRLDRLVQTPTLDSAS